MLAHRHRPLNRIRPHAVLARLRPANIYRAIVLVQLAVLLGAAVAVTIVPVDSLRVTVQVTAWWANVAEAASWLVALAGLILVGVTGALIRTVLLAGPGRASRTHQAGATSGTPAPLMERIVFDRSGTTTAATRGRGAA